MAGPQWKAFTIPISEFDGMNGHDLTGVRFAGGPEPGSFAFRIDEVRFR